MKELRLDFEGTPGTLDMVTHISIYGHWEKPVVFYRESPAYAALQAEVDRLRKAGDELARVAIPSYILDTKVKAIEGWNAAKGVQP